MMPISRQTAYWICQIGGWVGIGVLSTVSQTVLGEQNVESKSAVGLALALSVGILLTHLLRGHIRRHRWLDLGPAELVPRILLACFLLALANCVLMSALFRVVPLGEAAPGLTAEVILLLNWCLLLLGWCSIYFGVHYFEDYQRTRIEKWQLEATLRESELKALKSQLNPHFLFNSLNNLRGLILEDPARAQQVVTQLAAVLRYSLGTNESTVPLEEELRMVRNYLSLESIRLEERLDYDIYADPDTLKEEVPPMLIQGLVENGIKHGVSRRTQGGRLAVRVLRDSGALRIRVSNTGELPGGNSGNGVGLKNTEARLRLLYGEASSLTLRQASPGETAADVVIPLGRPA